MDNKLKEFLDRPETLFEIVDEVANGGSLIAYCKKNEMRYSNIINWIYADEARQKSYEVALEARGEYVAQEILAELKKLGFSDVRKLFNNDGSIKEVSALDDDTAAAIAGIEIQEEACDKDGETIVPRTRKIKIIDKLKAIEMLGRNLKMFTDKVEHSGKVSLEDLVNGSLKKEPESDAVSTTEVASPENKEEKPPVGFQNGKAESEPQEEQAGETDDGI